VQLNWNKTGTNKEIISELKDRLLFDTDDYSQADFEKILKYDFDPKTAGSENAVMRLFNYMIKTPEFSFKTTIMNRRHFLTLTGTFTGGSLLLPDFLYSFGSQNNLVIGEQCVVFCTIKWWK
jgi:hypothetical protein